MLDRIALGKVRELGIFEGHSAEGEERGNAEGVEVGTGNESDCCRHIPDNAASHYLLL